MLIKLFAGLGNQLFQLCYGLSLENKSVKFLMNPDDPNLTDITTLFSFPKDISKKIIKPQFLVSLQRAIIKSFYKYILHSYRIGFFQEFHFIEKAFSKFNLNETLTFINTEQYKLSPYYKEITNSNSVSLHIRGGDYLRSDNYFLGVCTPEYYEKAINLILKKNKDAHFFVFTNDFPYAESILSSIKLGKKSFTLVKENNIYDQAQDLYLMSCCKHNIIANSTYSWWAAFLNTNKEKIVVSPRNWVNPNKVTTEKLQEANKILIPSWEKI